MRLVRGDAGGCAYARRRTLRATSRIPSADLGKRAGWIEQRGDYQQLGFARFLLLHDGLLRARRRHRSRDPPHLINEKMRMRVPCRAAGTVTCTRLIARPSRYFVGLTADP